MHSRGKLDAKEYDTIKKFLNKGYTFGTIEYLFGRKTKELELIQNTENFTEYRQIKKERRKIMGINTQEPKRTIQVDILERFMSEEELAKFMKEYKSHTKKAGGMQRGISLLTPISDEELNLLKDYFNPEFPLGELVKKYDITMASVYGRIGRIAQRYLFQNRSKVGL